MLQDLTGVLVCPVCRNPLVAVPNALRCERGHSFDIARQGYANLLTAKAHTGTADTAQMIQSREAFLERGHFEPVSQELRRLAAQRISPGGIILDVGSGPGYYLSRTLDAVPGALGLALDISKDAARKAAKRHPRMSAIVADVWSTLPIADESISMITDVFSPRNPHEFSRILLPGAPLVVVSPTPAHLHEIADALSLLAIDESKSDALADAMLPYFDLQSCQRVSILMELSRADVVAVAAMGPAARHSTHEEMARAAQSLKESTLVTLSVDICVFDKRRTGKKQG